MQKKDRVAESISRLLHLNYSSEKIRESIQTRANEAIASTDYNLGAALSKILIDNQIENTELYQNIFLKHLQYNEREGAVNIWWNALCFVSSGSHIRQFLKTNMQYMDDVDSKLYLDCMNLFLSKNVITSLKPKIQREILVYHGRIIFEIDETRQDALALFNQAMKLNAKDHRIWMPLYFLLGEFGSANARKEHLNEIVPRLQEDGRPLKNYPLTIESLEVELEELRSSAPISFEAPSASNADSDEVEDENEEEELALDVVATVDSILENEDSTDNTSEDEDEKVDDITTIEPFTITPEQDSTPITADTEGQIVASNLTPEPVSIDFSDSSDFALADSPAAMLDLGHLGTTNALEEPPSLDVSFEIGESVSMDLDGAAVDLDNNPEEGTPILFDIEAAANVKIVEISNIENHEDASDLRIDVDAIPAKEDVPLVVDLNHQENIPIPSPSGILISEMTIWTVVWSTILSASLPL
jgi:hypothetical protein